MYVLGTVTLIIVIYCLFKNINLSRKINSVSDFINGEIFSEKFHSILSNYLSNPNHAKLLLEPLLPLVNEIITEKYSSTKNTDRHFMTNEIGGLLFTQE
jgi:hypothetical protein